MMTEEQKGGCPDRKTVDLFLFAGQSNMAGRGITTPEHPQGAPETTPGAGFEYRAVSDPLRLYALSEPFGRFENNPAGIDDGDKKTGSLVTAFVNAYYEKTGVPIVGVSASVGGSNIGQWQPGSAYLKDTAMRLAAAADFLSQNGYDVRHRFLLWCQGESDGDLGTAPALYRQRFDAMLSALFDCGIETCFLIRIGRYNGDRGFCYETIGEAQEAIAASDGRVQMVSRLFPRMKERGLMKDAFHYYQQAYNEVGTDAGLHAAEWVNGLRENTPVRKQKPVFIYLLRHGETDWNREGRLQGRTDIPLNALGRSQVRQAAEALAALCPYIDRIVSSPLQRAWESARIVAKRLGFPESRIESEPLLTERSYGAGEGLTAKERAIRYPDNRYPDMESYDGVQKRGLLAYEQLRQTALPGQNILLVAHGSILRGLITAVTAGTASEKEWGIFGNGSIYRIRWENGSILAQAVYTPARPAEESRLVLPGGDFQL